MTDAAQVVCALTEASRHTAALYPVGGKTGAQRRLAAVALRAAVAGILGQQEVGVALLAQHLRNPRYLSFVWRVLAMIPTPTSLQMLLDVALAPDIPGLYGIMQLPWSEDLAKPLHTAYVDAATDHHRLALLIALLRGPSAEGSALAQSILGTASNAAIREQIVHELSKRTDEQAASLLALGLRDRNARVRLEACFGLVLRGQRERVADLQCLYGERGVAIREAILYVFASLSLPEGVAAVRVGVRDKSPAVRAAAALAIAFLGDPAGIALLAELHRDARIQVRNQADAVFDMATGGSMPYPRTKASEIITSVVAALAPTRRYFQGIPWTMHALVGLLTDPVAARFANGNLVSATGQDCGFDPDRDLLSNLAAIERWERWIEEHEQEFSPGYWYYQGRQTG